MPRIAAGRLEVSRVGLGTASLHHLASSRARQRLLDTALASGITYYDTAPLYGNELAERELGLFIARAGSGICVATKFGLVPSALAGRFPIVGYTQAAFRKVSRALLPHGWQGPGFHRDYSPVYAVQRVESSLRNLGCEAIDILYVHEPDIASSVSDETIEALLRLKARGLVRFTGFAGQSHICGELAHRYPAVADVLQVEILPGKGGFPGLPRPPDVTYGHFRVNRAGDLPISAEDSLRRSAIEYPDGVLLVSSRRPERIVESVRLVRELGGGDFS